MGSNQDYDRSFQEWCSITWLCNLFFLSIIFFSILLAHRLEQIQKLETAITKVGYKDWNYDDINNKEKQRESEMKGGIFGKMYVQL